MTLEKNESKDLDPRSVSSDSEEADENPNQDLDIEIDRYVITEFKAFKPKLVHYLGQLKATADKALEVDFYRC